MWGPSSNASGVAHTMGFKVNSTFQILIFLLVFENIWNKGSTWWTGAFVRLHVTKYDVLMLIPLHICSSQHSTISLPGKRPLPGWSVGKLGIAKISSEAHVPSAGTTHCKAVTLWGARCGRAYTFGSVERAFVHLDYEFTHQSEHARSDDT